MPDFILLIKQIAQGNQQSFKALYQAFNERVYNTALSYVHTASDAEEITQDVFVEIYNSANMFKAESTVSTWIYRIAVNKSLDKLRYNKRKKRFAFIVDIFKPGSTTLKHDLPHLEHPGIALEQKENAATLFDTIAQLSEQQKTAFILTYIEELPQKEIAEVMGITVKAVESLLQRAKSNLRKNLEALYPNRRK